MNYVSEQNIDNIVKGLSNKIAMSVSNGALIGDTTPVGTVISFMGTQAPLYYLVCDGTIYNIVDYVELANFIEAQFGSKNYFGGDGTTTFAVPDLRGEFLRGSGINSYTNQGSGANVGVHQDGTEIPNMLAWVSSTSATNGSMGMHLTNTGESNYVQAIDAGIKGTPRTILEITGTKNTQSQEDSYRYTSRPTNTSVLYCIKYTKAVIPSEYEDGTPVGRVVFDSILREGYIKANGAQIEDASISIPRLLSFVQKYSSQLIASDQATYEANVGLYMYDSNNDILTLPNYIGRFMEGGNSVESIEAGLPNISGQLALYGVYGFNDDADIQTFGAFIPGTMKGRPAAMASSGEGTYYVTFDASNSNPIYSDSVNTVQPSSITLIPQIRY